MNLLSGDRSVLRRVSPKKLLQSKWTAMSPVDRELHFVVTRIVRKHTPAGPIERVELTAVYTGRASTLDWRELNDVGRWRPGWH